MTTAAVGVEQLKLLGFRVLAKEEKNSEKKVGSILIPESKEQKVYSVVAVGEPQLKDGKERTIPVKKQDRIILAEYANLQEVKIDDEQYFVVNADDIVAIKEK